MLPLEMLRMAYDDVGKVEKTVGIFFIGQSFLSCWPKTQVYESLA